MLSRLIQKIRHGIVTLRFSMLSIFVSLFMLTTLLLVSVASIRFEKMLTYTSYELMEDNASAVLSRLTSVMEPAVIESQFSVNLIDEGILTTDSSGMVNYTYHLVKMFPLIQGARWADAKGNFIVSQHDSETGAIFSEVYDRTHQPETRTIYERNLQGRLIKKYRSDDLQYDPRNYRWFTNAVARKNLVWSDVYYAEQIPSLLITATSPIFYPNGTLHGVFGLDIHLDYLLKFIAAQKVSPNSVSYIVTRDGKLVVFPGITTKIKSDQGISTLPTIDQVAAPVIAESLKYYNKTDREHFSIRSNGKTYLFTYTPIPLFSSYGWLVGIMVPKSDLTNDLEKMHALTLIISLITFILGMFVILTLVGRVVRPIHQLMRETEKITKLELDEEIIIPSRIKEVIELTNAMNGMKHGLRSFQKYVPRTLVKQLIDMHEDTRAGGVKKPLAILFTDIKNFTTIAETMDPGELMIHLCEYFDELSKIVMEYRGTIDKYIGDSIMAFWGAPIAEEHSCEQAALAALRCIQHLDDLNIKWLSQGKPVLISRVGIHMGDAIVGNLGSSERLNYTAIGDAINIASRLEQINKNYGTRIMVSDVVYEQIKDQFVLRLVDLVAVKGKHASGYIYELLAEYTSEVKFDINRYRDVFSQGFAAYRNEEWDVAIQHFKTCADIYLDDSVAPLFISRCEYFKTNPPHKDWNGVWRIA